VLPERHFGFVAQGFGVPPHLCCGAKDTPRHLCSYPQTERFRIAELSHKRKAAKAMGCHAGVIARCDAQRETGWGLQMKMNVLLGGVALPVLALAAIIPAFAQSTGTDAVEETVIVTGQKSGKGGLIKPETVTKTRSTVDQSYFKTQTAGQSVIQSLNLVPGFNFTNSDPYGSSGGNIRMRGFDGNRVSLTSDGVPLNDTGNYALFTNQQLDSEIIARATVNVGTTDVDSPTASATGGSINLNTRKPDQEFTVRATGSAGDYDYGRGFLSLDSGAFGPWDTMAFLTGSYQKYDKFKGPGELEKKQFNGRVYQDIGENGDFVSFGFHYNENRNAFYRNLTQLAPAAAVVVAGDLQNPNAPSLPGQTATFGFGYDNFASCTRDAPTNAVGPTGIDNDGSTTLAGGAENILNPGSCTNYFGLRINPSNTGNFRAQSSFTLGSGVRLTVDPSFQYVLANGGGTTVVSETDQRLRGNNLITNLGVDLNGDGDIRDSVRLYTPNNTNTYRYGVTASLIWEIDDNNTLRAAYTLDYGRHRQTGEFSFLTGTGDPTDVFGGRNGGQVNTADGNFLRGRDRFSIARLNQLAISYNGSFDEDRLKLALGVRLPYFERELNQSCFSQNGTSTVLCTTEVPNAPLANGNLTFPGRGTTQYIAPFSANRKYDAILPNVGVSYQFAEGHTIYASFAQGLSAPRTDNLYTPIRNPVTFAIDLNNADPEKTDTYDLGYRYYGEQVTASAAVYTTKYTNRIVSAFDEVLGINIDRNVGKVDLWGFDVALAYQPDWAEGLTLYGSASYIDSELKDNVPLSATTFLPTRGKKLVETPDWTFGTRAEYTIDNLTFGLQGKYVSKRWSTDLNDEYAPAYFTMDASVRYDIETEGWTGSYIQLNAINIFDRGYYGNISSTNNARPQDIIGSLAGRTGSAPTYSIGAPATVQLSIGLQY